MFRYALMLFDMGNCNAQVLVLVRIAIKTSIAFDLFSMTLGLLDFVYSTIPYVVRSTIVMSTSRPILVN